MVKVGGKEVPFFAADGKGANDLKRAMYGMKMQRAAYGAKMEMGKGGKMYEMMGGGLVKQFEDGGPIENGDDNKPTFFMAKGFDNRGEMPSGREIAALFVRTPEGPQQINPKDLMEYFPEARDIFEAYQKAGIAIKRTKDNKIMFPTLGDDGTVEGRREMIRSNRALMEEFGVDSMDALKDTLKIARVPYERERDLPRIVPGYDPRSDM